MINNRKSTIKQIPEARGDNRNYFNKKFHVQLRNHLIFLKSENPTMFDEDDYVSDEDENVMYSSKNVASSNVLSPSSGPEFNNMAGDGESLLKMMKDRGFDMTDNEVKKIKEPRQVGRSSHKDKNAKPKAGFFDGGDKASVQELIKALNKAFSKADPQQASCILSYILEKKNLSVEDRNKFSIMKCNILFGLGAYQECQSKSQQFLPNALNKLSGATFSNFIAKCKIQNDELLSGYMDFLRAKSQIQQYKEEQELMARQKQAKQKQEESQKGISTSSKSNTNVTDEDMYLETDVDSTTRQINHTQMEYNIKMTKYKNNTNLIHPFYPQFRHRKILQVVCGDYHALFLVGGALSGDKSDQDEKWGTQVFGIGENTVGQVTGIERKIIYKEPILISSLSGKGIQGIYANKQSSLAYDINGNIYQWGIKEKRNDKVEMTFTVGEQILKVEKGYKHYALLTKSGKFYSWGTIENKGVVLYNQPKPHMQDSKNITGFSCGNSHTVAVDSEGNVYALGSNQQGQLGMYGQRFSKAFRKINNNMLADIKKVFAISDSTFFVNEDCEVFFCGKYSYKKEAQQKIKQAEFSEQFKDLISISGSVGVYYATNERGICYKWDVDSMVKFKTDREDQINKVSQRYVEACRGYFYRVRSTINPKFCSVSLNTDDLRTFQPIKFEFTLKDDHGLYGLTDFIIPPKCQIFLSTYKAKEDELLNDNKMFLESHAFCTTNTDKILLNEIIQQRLLEYKIVRRQDQPWMADLNINVEASGRYHFYVLLENHIVYQKQLEILVSEKEKELEEKNKQQKMSKQEERRRKAEMQRQRLAEQKLRKELQEEDRRKETQKRAEQALKKHMRDQEESKNRIQQERRARKQMQTGGGFDLNKLKKKNSDSQKFTSTQLFSQTSASQELSSKFIGERSEKMEKTGESFLPDINQRPSSRKKVNLPKPSEIVGSFRGEGGQKPVLRSSIGDFATTGFVSEKPSTPLTKNLGTTGTTTVRQSLGTKVSSTTTTTTGLVKRGLSKKKN